MPRNTKSQKPKGKANPALEDDEKDVAEGEETTDTDEVEEEAEGTDEETEVEAAETPARGSKAGKGAKAKPLIEREEPKRRSQNSIEAEISKDLLTVKQALEKQPKVRIFVPLGIGEKKGSKSAYESVTINGYRMVLPKGEYVTVPQGVADIIEAHYNMTPENTEAGEAYRLDRNRVKEDGMSTDEALLNG